MGVLFVCLGYSQQSPQLRGGLYNKLGLNVKARASKSSVVQAIPIWLQLMPDPWGQGSSA